MRSIILYSAQTENVKKVIEKGYDSKRVQLMAPMYAGVNGIDNINKVVNENNEVVSKGSANFFVVGQARL